MTKNLGGRPSIFSPKNGMGVRVQALTQWGSAEFEAARVRLAGIAKWEPTRVSDADTVEYLLRGERATKTYLAAKQ